MSELSVDKITGKTGTGGSNSPLQFSGDTVTLGTGTTIGTGATIGSGASLANAIFPAGHVLQVLTTAKTDVYSTSTSAGTFYNPTGLSVAITPVSTSSKILVMCSLFIGTSSTYELACKIQKTISASTSDVLVGDSSGSVSRAMFTRRLSGARDSSSSTMIVLDSPNTTSEITYKPAITVEGGVTIYLNKTQGQADVNHDYNGASQITVMEIAG